MELSGLFPVNKHASLNRDKVGWWMVLPQHRWGGGPVWRDLMRGRNGDGVFESSMTAGDWVRSSRPGSLGGAIDLDGTDDHVDLGASYDVLNGVGAMTVAFWAFFRDATFPGFDGVIGLGENTNRQVWVYGQNGSNTLNFRIGTSSASTGDIAIVSNAITANTWTHYTLTWDGTNGALYEDGGAPITDTSTGNTALTLSTQERFFGEIDGFGRMDGQLDDIGFWDRGLSATEAQALFQASKTGYRQELNWLVTRAKAPAAAAGNALPHILAHDHFAGGMTS